MKKTIAVVFLLVGAATVFAQKWLVEGQVFFDAYSFDNSVYVSRSTTFGLAVNAAYYVIPKLAVGARGAFDFDDAGSSIVSGGPMVRWDALQFGSVTLSLAGTVLFSAYNDTYGPLYYSDGSSAYADAIRITATIAPRFSFAAAKFMDIYMEVLRVSFLYTWGSVPGSRFNSTEFYVSGPLSSPSFGLSFRF
jgi:hypothetical protein